MSSVDKTVFKKEMILFLKAMSTQYPDNPFFAYLDEDDIETFLTWREDYVRGLKELESIVPVSAEMSPLSPPTSPQD